MKMNMKHELPSWDMPANGDKEVKSNRPDIIVMPLINLLTFNTSEISSSNSEKLSLAIGR